MGSWHRWPDYLYGPITRGVRYGKVRLVLACFLGGQRNIRSFHFKLEYHVCLTCLHPNRENNTTRPYLNQYFAFALQEPAIVKRCRGRPGGSINRINNPT